MEGQAMMGLPAAVRGAVGEVSLESGERPIDLVHLARMTLGDRSLEREVLQLFVRQAAVLLDRMEAADPDSVPALAHTLRGSAQGLGARRVTAAAEAVERAADDVARSRAGVWLCVAVVEQSSGVN